MSNIITVATPIAPIGSDEYVIALGEMPDATLEQIEEGCEAVLRIEQRHKDALSSEERLAREAQMAQAMKIAQAEAELQREEEAFQIARKDAAYDLVKMGETEVAAALRGKHAPAWAKGVLERFLGRFPKGKRGRFHSVVERTLEVVAEAMAIEAAEEAEAQRIREEAKRRQEANRRDRASRQSRDAKGHVSSKK